MSWDRYRPAIGVLVELRHLRYFVAVGEEEHFGRAAERLHVVQPALTRQVRQLEEELGYALFERLKWGVRLTEPASRFSRRPGESSPTLDAASIEPDSSLKARSGAYALASRKPLRTVGN